MSDKLFTLDTNILVYAIDRDSKEKHARAKEVVNQAMSLNCVLTIQALGELYTTTTRKKYATSTEIMYFIEGLMEVFPTVAASSTTLILAINSLKRYSMSFWDAMLWATVKESNCKFILSEDFQHNSSIDGIKIINPLLEDVSLEQLFQLV
ncbi:MAG: PIN domain-containing protein [Alphaproteobacteria bacterium]|nr:PIN domain-containing protein [Alphaproteobacteria bacterium]